MSLSTQLNRGTLALPLLALFGALALFANEPVDAQPILPAAISGQPTEASDCSALPRPTMMLAQAPADLGPLARHQQQFVAPASDCRA